MKLSLGYFPERSIGDARALAAKLNAEIDKSRDPASGTASGARAGPRADRPLQALQP